MISSILSMAIVVGLASAGFYIVTKKSRYETAAKEIKEGLLEPHPFTPQTERLIETIESEWLRTQEDPSPIETDALTTIEYPVNIEGLKQLFCQPAPSFSLIDLPRNQQSSAVLLTQALMIPISTDGIFHFDADKALILLSDSAAQIYRERNGQIETYAYLKTNRPLP